MGKGIEGLEQAYGILFTLILIFLAVLALLCLLRAVIGPKTADRIVAVNMLGTMVIVMIAVLTLMLQEDYLADICVIYAMISFLAVIVLTKVYMGVYLERKKIAEMSGEMNPEKCGENGETEVTNPEKCGKNGETEVTNPEKCGENGKTEVTNQEKCGENGEVKTFREERRKN